MIGWGRDIAATAAVWACVGGLGTAMGAVLLRMPDAVPLALMGALGSAVASIVVSGMVAVLTLLLVFLSYDDVLYQAFFWRDVMLLEALTVSMYVFFGAVGPGMARLAVAHTSDGFLPGSLGICLIFAVLLGLAR